MRCSDISPTIIASSNFQYVSSDIPSDASDGQDERNSYPRYDDNGIGLILGVIEVGLYVTGRRLQRLIGRHLGPI